MKSTKTGADHLAALRDGRSLVLDGKVISNHVDHPAFRRAIKTAAGLYDYSAEAENIEAMTFVSPTSGGRVSLAWQLPKSYEELVKRRKALEKIAAYTYGWIGRTPDHVASTLSAMVMGIDLFRSHGQKRAAALEEYFRWARDNDIWCAYAIVPPQNDKPTDPGEPRLDFVNAGVCDEDEIGITIKGARLLATGVPMAQELLVAAVEPLRPGEEKYSFTAMVPLADARIKLLSRKSYEAANPSLFDYPLSSRFDENDCIVYFDEVKIPWERVFVHNDTRMAQAQWYQLPVMAYQNYPAQIRLTVKLRFLLGLAYRMIEANGSTKVPAVQEQLGQMAAEVSTVEGLVHAMEIKGNQYGEYFIPDRALQYSSMVFSQQLYPTFITRIRELTGGGMIALPSSHADLLSPEIAGYVDRTQRTATMSANDRVRLFKLGWDAIGSEFASRHSQYEVLYAGPTFVSRMRTYRAFDWESATTLVDQFLSTEELSTPAPG